MNFTKSILLVAILAALFASGLAVRRVVLNAQYGAYGRPLPFDLESALAFRYVRMLFDGRALPAVDKAVQYPDGVVVRQTYEVGMEYICAGLARLFPDSVGLDERSRWISAVWFCLGIVALALWLWWWQRSLWGAALAGAFYAVSLASVIRSTGQDLSHENFALPLLIAHLAAAALAERNKTSLLKFVGAVSVSALLLALALVLWDLVQFYIILWALLGFIRVVKGRYFREGKQRLKWALYTAALVLAGLINPYQRAHGFLASPAMLLSYGALAAMTLSAWRWAGAPPPDSGSGQRWRATVLRAGVALLPLITGLGIGGSYALAYNHFGELICAKMLFLNVKPADPALLTFAQRILWTPALHSANILLTKTLFPVTLLLFSVSAVIFVFNPRWRKDPEITELLFFSFMSFIAFILFVRLHVFAAVGFAASAGLLCAGALRWKRGMIRAAVVIVLLAGVGAEAANVLRDPVRWGSIVPYLGQKLELVDWLRQNAPGEPVLANFGTSAFVLAYAGCPIILHPKFESPEARKRVEEYGNLLFKADEGRFRSWADKYGAAFYIHSLGEFADVYAEMQMRYFVNALDPPPEAPARLFEYNPSRSRWFVLLWQNSKYRVFRIITGADESRAEAMTREAETMLAKGQFREAWSRVEQAFLYDQGNTNALAAAVRIDALRRKGNKKP